MRSGRWARGECSNQGTWGSRKEGEKENGRGREIERERGRARRESERDLGEQVLFLEPVNARRLRAVTGL
jgi:hypothetical protein